MAFLPRRSTDSPTNPYLTLGRAPSAQPRDLSPPILIAPPPPSYRLPPYIRAVELYLAQPLPSRSLPPTRSNFDLLGYFYLNTHR